MKISGGRFISLYYAILCDQCVENLRGKGLIVIRFVTDEETAKHNGRYSYG